MDARTRARRKFIVGALRLSDGLVAGRQSPANYEFHIATKLAAKWTDRGILINTMNIRLRRSSEGDLDFVLSAEQSAENRSFVTVWTREQHLRALTSEDLSHLIIESTADRNRVGYIILAGLADANLSIEFRRIVVTEKGKGYGKEALRLAKKLAFEELKAHRLWLDVKEHNVRARHLYESEGFVAEGVLRECIKADVGFESLVVMSMLSAEYHDAQQQ